MFRTVAVFTLITLVSIGAASAAGTDSNGVAVTDEPTVSSAAGRASGALPPASSMSPAVSLHNGLVSVTAKNATLSEILKAWASAGETTIVSADGVTTARVTLNLVDVPEEEALALLLRSMSGYLVVRRSDARAGTSHFARIVILPTSVGDQHSAVGPASSEALFTPAPPPQPAPVTMAMASGVTRLIGPNGLPVEDDQTGVSPGTGVNRSQKALRTSLSAPGPVGSAAPGMVISQPLQGQPLSPSPQRSVAR
jgi:hypothetical protein